MYVKADQLRQNETITSIWNDNRKANIAEESISVPVYKNADGTYTIHADAPFKNGIVLVSDYDKVDINVANGNNNGERITKGITIDKDHFAVIADESAMGTTVRDSNSTDHVGTVGKKASVIDTIGYQNLAVGQIYWFEGQLMKKDGTPYLDADGKPVKAVSERIVPKQTEEMKQKDIYYQNGQIEITFNFNATNLNGENLTNELRDLVVFEKMYTASLKNPKTEIGKHEDTKDESQTLHYSEIHTTLYLNNMKNGQEYDLKQTKLEKGITDISARRHERKRQPAVLQKG